MEEKFIDNNIMSHINIVRGSVVNMHVDAIVNAANESLLGGGGVDGAIHQAAGIELLKECISLHGCKTGQAKMTKAYNIKNAKYIIHTVGPIYKGVKEDAKMLASCYINSLNLAYENELKSIAFPGISTGVYGYPLNEAASISLKAVFSWLENHKNSDIKVCFCCFKEQEYQAYLRIINNI